MQHDQTTATVALLGADTVVGRALCALLEASGYRTTPLDSHPTGVVDDLLDGADLLLLAPRLNEDARESFLGAMGKNIPQRASMPVIVLSTAVEESPPDQGVISVPWPCETNVLVNRIEAALSVQESSTAPHTQAEAG